jgi:hypothetical protein
MKQRVDPPLNLFTCCGQHPARAWVNKFSISQKEENNRLSLGRQVITNSHVSTKSDWRLLKQKTGKHCLLISKFFNLYYTKVLFSASKVITIN